MTCKTVYYTTRFKIILLTSVLQLQFLLFGLGLAFFNHKQAHISVGDSVTSTDVTPFIVALVGSRAKLHSLDLRISTFPLIFQSKGLFFEFRFTLRDSEMAEGRVGDIIGPANCLLGNVDNFALLRWLGTSLYFFVFVSVVLDSRTTTRPLILHCDCCSIPQSCTLGVIKPAVIAVCHAIAPTNRSHVRAAGWSYSAFFALLHGFLSSDNCKFFKILKFKANIYECDEDRFNADFVLNLSYSSVLSHLSPFRLLFSVYNLLVHRFCFTFWSEFFLVN